MAEDPASRAARAFALLALCALAPGCAGGRTAAPPLPPAAPPVPAAAGGRALMRRILASPPDLTWEVSALLPPSDYLFFPRCDGQPGFFLTRNGFSYLDPEDFSLRYERSAEGFRLVEVRKRSGTTRLAECPVYFPVQNCVEQHHLMLATVLACEASCTYRFVVFDSQSPFPIALHDPRFPRLFRLIDGEGHLPFGVEVKYQEEGAVFDSDADWAEFIRERFAFIAGSIRDAEKPPGFRLASPLAW